jgi:hypothetical protein
MSADYEQHHYEGIDMELKRGDGHIYQSTEDDYYNNV